MSNELSTIKLPIDNNLVELEHLATILDIAEDAIISIDSNQKIILFNKGAEKIFGYKAEEILGQNLSLLLPKRFADSHPQQVKNFEKSNVVARTMAERREVVALRRDGSEFPADASISKYKVNSQYHFNVILRDISIRKKTEEALRNAQLELERRLYEQTALLDFAPNAVFILDLEDKVMFWSKGAERIYGWTKEETIGKEFYKLVYATDLSHPLDVCNQVLTKGEWFGELTQYTKSGKKIIVESRRGLVRNTEAKPTAQLLVNTDITEKKALETQFLRSQRMESIGTLAGGIAHDLNNVLAPLIMGLEILSEDQHEPDKQELIQAMLEHSKRGADLVKQVLSFARGVAGERILINPKKLIEKIEKILIQTFPKNINIKIKIPNNLWAFKADETQLNQVLMNLCINARDAMLEGGDLSISISNVSTDEQYTKTHLEAKLGNFIVISVSDTGLGMTEEVANKIFEPFFTTKEIGKGTGLGLSTVLAIVKSHEGFISVYSEPSIGTTFQVYFPALTNQQDIRVSQTSLEIFSGQGELILLVDDEVLIRQVTKTTLEHNGYKVVTAKDGVEAIKFYQNNKEAVKLSIIDLIMPNLDGQKTANKIREINPQAKIIYASGFALKDKFDINFSDTIFLHKPYTAAKLLETIATVLSTNID
ncbi:MAG: PAS domain S-box protein [Acidobacteria bacterium]|nr:PAS domain S-box protein [Acidobacteriota bacterium]